eukprot:scaffold91718_cov63-Phaeocystis_antarctica.AAC.1
MVWVRRPERRQTASQRTARPKAPQPVVYLCDQVRNLRQAASREGRATAKGRLRRAAARWAAEGLWCRVGTWGLKWVACTSCSTLGREEQEVHPRRAWEAARLGWLNSVLGRGPAWVLWLYPRRGSEAAGFTSLIVGEGRHGERGSNHLEEKHGSTFLCYSTYRRRQRRPGRVQRAQ